MNAIQALLEQLQDTDAATANLEMLVRSEPGDETHEFNIQALKKRRVDLERRLNTELHITQADLIQYHVNQPENNRYPVAAVAKTLGGFQELVTAVFDAMRSTPKQRYRPSADSIVLSTLEFDMALPVGSVLVSMSIDNERLLAIQSDLDEAFQCVFEILRARDSESLRRLAEQVGIAAISKAHDWAESSSSSGFDTKISIIKDIDTKSEFTISRTEALSLKEVIEEKSDQTREVFVVVGELVGIDVQYPNTYFHLKNDDGQNFEGRLADTFSADEEWAVHVRYAANLIKVVTIRYATGEEKIDWLLAGLSLPPT